MNAMNTYGYAVFWGKGKPPLHVVAIYSEVHIAFNVFDNARDAGNYIRDNCNHVTYNPDFDFQSDFGDLLKAYQNANKNQLFKGTNHQLYIRCRSLDDKEEKEPEYDR
jgi:hypothetical protein